MGRSVLRPYIFCAGQQAEDVHFCGDQQAEDDVADRPTN
jgi:hypothetical protein